MATASLHIDSLPDSIQAKYDRSSLDVNARQMAREVPRQHQRNAEDVQLLKFPSTKNILWDHSETGDPQILHISYFRKPRLCITEKVLRFAQRHVESGSEPVCSCVLVGSLDIDEDGEGVLFNVERLDPVGDPNSSTSHAAGDMLIPFTIQTGSKERGSTSDDYCNALQLLRQRCCSKDPVDLGNFMLTKGWCSFYTTGETCVHHLEFDVVTMGTEIRALPIGPVPIVPTALSKNLSGPMSISHMQGTSKSGYLTMDHTRKLLLVLESDPKVINLPLVGIWVSGVSYIYSPYVWACCLRYLHNSSIQDRVCNPPDPFLLVLYNPTHSKPEFYECSTATGSNKMSFDFYTGYEAVQISKNTMGGNETVEIDLNLMRDGRKYELFGEAVRSSADSGLDVSRRSVSPDAVSHDDITPRMKPAPHKSKLPMMQSMVPEVSLFFGDGDTTFVPNVQHPKGPQPVVRFGAPRQQPMTSSNPPQSFNGHIQNQSVPNNNSSCAQNRQASVTVANYVNNAHGVKITSSSASGGRSANIPHHGNGHQAINVAPIMPGQVSPQGYPSSLPATQHNTHVHVPPTGYQSLPGVPTGPSQRSTFCSCPSCPKPPQFYNGPQSYDGMRGALPPTRPVYSNYGPPPPRLSGQYPGYPPHHSAGYPHQAPTLRSQPYPPFSQEIPHPSTAQYPPAAHVSPAQINMYQQYNPQESVQNMPMASQANPSAHQNTVPLHSNMIRTAVSQVPHAMKPMSSPPAPNVGGGLPVKADGNLPITPGQSAEGTVSVSKDARRSNPGSDSSGRSSDDSGLSFTPEKHHSPSNPSPKPTQAAGDMKSTLATVNWDNIPSEIYQLLMQQDRQLKELQAQIVVLTVQQAQSLNNSAESTVNTKPSGPAPREKCTIATNTTVGLCVPNEKASACMQTSQQEAENVQHDYENVRQVSNSAPVANRDMSHSSSNGSDPSGCDPRTPAEIRHRGRLLMNSTQREDADLDISQGELVALMNNMHDRTIDSVQSEMIVDLPSFQSSPTRSPRSQESCNDSAAFNLSPRSPISASMCEQDLGDSGSEDEEEDNTAGTDNPEYYNKLMDNIKKLLSQNTTENTTEGDGGYSGDVSSDFSTPVRLAREDIDLGEHLQSFIRFEQRSTTAPADTTFIPKINYVSMLLDSDTDTSMEINAMAMKYLKDEQLTQLTKLQARNRLLQGSKKTSEKTALLQKILRMEDDSTPNVTTVGMSPNDLTFATKRYLEKHGLLEGGASSGSTSASDTVNNDSYRLRTNYSTLTSGSEDGPAQITQEVLRTPTSRQSGTAHTPNADAMCSNGATPTSVSRQSVGFNRTPRPNHVQSRIDTHRRLTAHGSNTRNSSVPQSFTASPFSQNSSSPYGHDSSSRRDIGATGRYVSPHITRPPSQPNHSPPEREIANDRCSTQELRKENDGFRSNRREYGKHMTVQHKQIAEDETEGVRNYYDSRQHRPETVEDDRILDITRLKQLPKLL